MFIDPQKGKAGSTKSIQLRAISIMGGYGLFSLSAFIAHFSVGQPKMVVVGTGRVREEYFLFSHFESALQNRESGFSHGCGCRYYLELNGEPRRHMNCNGEIGIGYRLARPESELTLGTRGKWKRSGIERLRCDAKQAQGWDLFD